MELYAYQIDIDITEIHHRADSDITDTADRVESDAINPMDTADAEFDEIQINKLYSF